jgi:hypothetical protein
MLDLRRRLSGTVTIISGLCGFLFLIMAIACGGSKGTATSPSSTTLTLSGQVTDDMGGRGISGATVSIADGLNAGKSTTTDGLGDYSFTGLQQAGFTVNVSASNYVSQSKGVTLTSNQILSFHLRRVSTTSTFHLTGIATDDDGDPVTGATVTLNPNGDFGGTSMSGVTDGAGSYHLDFDSPWVPGNLIAFLIAQSPGHDRYVASISAPASGGHKRITAGESTLVTVVPRDTSCDENGYYFCRTVHIVVPTDGLLTTEVVPTPSTANTGLTLVGDVGPFGPSRVMHVTAGTEVVVWVGMVWTSTLSQTGVFKTSLTP